MKVFCYFNLHKKCWSIKALSGPFKGRVIVHATSVELLEPTCKVSEAGRQRVLATKRKNVHAGLVGQLIGFGGKCLVEHDWGVRTHETPEGEWVAITYNPYKAPTFTRRDDGRAVTGAHWAFLGDRYCEVLEPHHG